MVDCCGEPGALLSAASLHRFLAPLKHDRHIVILQARYSGSLFAVGSTARDLWTSSGDPN